jgi:uncharacterized protein (DUF2249 family)
MRLVAEVDIRGAPPAERPPACLSSFDSLEPGEAILVITRDDPRPLLTGLQQERTDQFDWSPLEDQIELHRVHISRRARATPRAVGEFMDTDHRRLESLLTEIECLAHQHSFETARKRFAELSRGLNRHLDMEGLFILPTFQRLGGEPELCQRLLDEHNQLRCLLADLSWRLEQEDVFSTVAQASDLHEILGTHCAHEMAVYGVTESGLGDQSVELIRSMQAL